LGETRRLEVTFPPITKPSVYPWSASSRNKTVSFWRQTVLNGLLTAIRYLLYARTQVRSFRCTGDLDTLYLFGVFRLCFFGWRLRYFLVATPYFYRFLCFSFVCLCLDCIFALVGCIARGTLVIGLCFFLCGWLLVFRLLSKLTTTGVVVWYSPQK